jgi:hypothetical protein
VDRKAAPWIEGLARLGFIAVGLVYTIVGVMSAAAGLHGRSRGADKNDAFAFILDKPFGKVLLFVITAGLLGYAVWRFICGIKDAEHRGNEPKGLALRAGSIVRGLFYAGIAAEVARFATRGVSGGSSDASAKHWTARLMDAPFGQWLVGAAALSIIGAGIYQLANAWRAKLSSQLRLGSMDASVRRRVTGVSRFGIGARGVVFLAVGYSVLRAALRHSSDAAKGASGALQQFGGPASAVVLTVVGVGLAAYGMYAFVNAKYRKIDAM